MFSEVNVNVELQVSWRNLTEMKRQRWNEDMMIRFGCLYKERKNQTCGHRKILLTLDQSQKLEDVKYFQINQRKKYSLMNERSVFS